MRRKQPPGIVIIMYRKSHTWDRAAVAATRHSHNYVSEVRLVVEHWPTVGRGPHRLSITAERTQTADLHMPSLSAERTQTADLKVKVQGF